MPDELLELVNDDFRLMWETMVSHEPRGVRQFGSLTGVSAADASPTYNRLFVVESPEVRVATSGTSREYLQVPTDDLERGGPLETTSTDSPKSQGVGPEYVFRVDQNNDPDREP